MNFNAIEKWFIDKISGKTENDVLGWFPQCGPVKCQRYPVANSNVGQKTHFWEVGMCEGQLQGKCSSKELGMACTQSKHTSLNAHFLSLPVYQK